MTKSHTIRLVFFGLLLALGATRAFSQAVIVAGVTDPGTVIYYVNEVQNTLNTVSNTAAEVQNGIQMIKDEEQALQSLGSGGWQGFLNAFDYETHAIDTYNAALQQLPSLSQIDAVEQLIQTQGYAQAAESAKALANSFNAADSVLHSTDGLIKDTQQRQLSAATLESDAHTAGSPVQLAQLRLQELDLLRGEIADTNMTLQSEKEYEEVQIENQQMATELIQAWAQHYDNGTTTYHNVEPDASTVDKNSPAFQPH